MATLSATNLRRTVVTCGTLLRPRDNGQIVGPGGRPSSSNDVNQRDKVLILVGCGLAGIAAVLCLCLVIQQIWLLKNRTAPMEAPRVDEESAPPYSEGEWDDTSAPPYFGDLSSRRRLAITRWSGLGIYRSTGMLRFVLLLTMQALNRGHSRGTNS